MPDVQSLVGTIRQFGLFGPIYQVLASPRALNDQELRIVVIESGEEFDYGVEEIASDPLAE